MPPTLHRLTVSLWLPLALLGACSNETPALSGAAGQSAAETAAAASQTVAATASAASQPAAETRGAAEPAAYGNITRERLLAADSEPGQWMTSGRDFGKSHYSSLDQINVETVGRLGFAWEYALGTSRGQEATPIVVDGVLYTSGTTGRAY